MGKILLLAVCLATLASPSWALWDRKDQATPPIDRYKLFDSGGGLFLLDTVTGLTWRKVHALEDPNNMLSDPLAIYWSPMTKFDTDEDEIRFTNYIDEYKQSQRAKKEGAKQP